MADCPISFEELPKPLHKHVDVKAPVALRMMGAKGLVPAVAAPDLVTMLFILSFDADPQVAETALKTVSGLPDKITGVALRSEEVPGPVLDWIADRYAGKDSAIEHILLNPSTEDHTIARLASVVSQPLGEIIRQNELRILREPEIIRQLCKNPNALASTIDGICDFCVRNGMTLIELPQMVEAHKRIYGIDPTLKPPEPVDTAEALIKEFHDVLGGESDRGPEAESAEEQRRKLTITQRIMKMSVSEKVKLATLGNKEARNILLRDGNKLVQEAAVTSPRVTESEIFILANSRTASADVLRHIYQDRDYTKIYAIKMSLVKNPKVPLPTALKFLPTLKEKDIKDLSRDRNVPHTVQAQAKAWVDRREKAMRGPQHDK
jgi:hypothetical protein